MAGCKSDFLCTPGLDPLVFYWAVITVPTTCDLCFVQMNLAKLYYSRKENKLSFPLEIFIKPLVSDFIRQF